ncbi:MAG: hypothetical protein GXX99_03675 [Clostridiales bacterium]|nr:hypothetical protein [Clostridiales bacterium]
MKKLLLKGLLLMVMALLLLSACGKPAEKSTSSDPDPSQASADGQEVPAPPAGLLKQGWPADLAPAELPAYTSGTVTASAVDGDGVLTIRVVDTGKSDLYVYLGSLQNAGWIVSSDDDEAAAVLGLYTATFDLQGGGSTLQIDVYTAQAGSWPASDLPPDILPPETGVLVGVVEVMETGEDMWYFNYTYDDMDETAANDYMDHLMQHGWSGDTYQLYKSFAWKGHNYEASIEVYETVETRTTFTCNFYLSS